MNTKKHRWIAFALASVLAVFVAVPTASHADMPKKKKHVKCEITDGGKTEIKKVATAEECTAMGGKVVAAKKK
jgi:hypothetical protein